MRYSFPMLPAAAILLAMLVTPVAGQTADSAAALRAHCHEIDFDAFDFDDLEFLREVLSDKRVVLLGESNHGTREFFLHKNRLIRFLHEELDFDVLLLESGIGEVYTLNHRRDELTPRQMLAGLIGPWRSSEWLELMQYVKESPELYVGGYDVQRSGRTFAGVLSRAVGAIDAWGAASPEVLERRFGDAAAKLTDRRRKLDAETEAEVAELRAELLAARDQLRAGEPSLTRAGWTRERVALVAGTLENRVAYLDYFVQWKRDNDWNRRWAARDAAMAENVLLFAEELFPDEKIIISAHNFHVARSNPKELVMGELLAEKLGASMYSVGLFAGTGTFANNSRKPERLGAPTDDRDIQRIIGRIGMPSAFLDIPAEPAPGLEWLFAPAIANHTFLDLSGSSELTLAGTFDGLVLVAEISPARY